MGRGSLRGGPLQPALPRPVFAPYRLISCPFDVEYCIIYLMANPPLVLIADDEMNFREIFSAKLTACGFQVQTAQNGEEAVALTKQLKPDLVLMDVQMPKLNGIEALIKIKADPECDSIPILFLTALGDPRMEIQEINRRLSKEVGAIGYLKKTDDLDTIVDYIKNFVQ